MCIEIGKGLLVKSKLSLAMPQIEKLPKELIECRVTRSKANSHDQTGSIKYRVGLTYINPNTEYLKNIYSYFIHKLS